VHKEKEKKKLKGVDNRIWNHWFRKESRKKFVEDGLQF